MTIFAFSLSDTFDTIGTFIGTGRKTGIFTAEDQLALETSNGFKSKMDKALFADATATSIGAIFGTSNTTTYVESAAGIGAGGRTGLTSVVTAAMFIISAFFAPLISAVPSAATAPALIVVGIMMLSAFKEIEWTNLEEAIPAFFAGIFMAFCYSISYGIAAALEGAGYKVGTKWPVITGQDAETMAIKNIKSGKQTMTVFKDTRLLASKCVTMVQAVMEGKQPEINDTKSYNNGKLVVPSYLCTPVAITQDNIQKELIDSEYYKESDIS